jgi:hypothetical protein
MLAWIGNGDGVGVSLTYIEIKGLYDALKKTT